MSFSSYAGAGFADGLERASSTLLQIQMAKSKMAQDAQSNKIEQNYKKASTEYMTHRLDLAQQQAARDAQTAANFDAFNKFYGIMPSGQPNQGQPNQQGGHPIAGASSTINGTGSLPQQSQPRQLPPGTEVSFDSSGKERISIRNPNSDPSKNQLSMDKQVEAFSKSIDPTQNVRTPMGISKIANDRAQRLKALVNAYPDGNLDSRQTEELALGIQSMLSGSSGGSGGAQDLVKGLIPQSAAGDFQKIVEWWKNDPQGMNQQEFVKRLKGTLDREEYVTGKQVLRNQYQRIAGFQSLRKSNPDAFNEVLSSMDIDPKDYDAWVKGGHKPIDVEPPEGELNGNKVGGKGDAQQFNIKGKTYNIPSDKVDEFKKDMGL